MASPQQTITGELRKWHHSFNSRGDKCVMGKMYNDISDIWEDGEDAIIFYINWVESVHFYLAVTQFGAIKCSKDEHEEKKDEVQKFNGSNNPEKG